MRTKPPGVDDRDLREVLSSSWLFEADSLAYEPVGAGSYHWAATDRHGSRRFVTVDDLAMKPWLGSDADSTFPALKDAYEVAARLRGDGLDFVVAPLPTSRGDALVRLTERFTVAVFPFVEGTTADFDGIPGDAERHALLRMWAELHSATAAVGQSAPRRGFAVPLRLELEAAMDETDREWLGGPLSGEARKWVGLNRDYISRALMTHERVADTVTRRGDELVITHGEPHGMNIIRSSGKLHLIDWDTAGLALPERDLWMLDDGTLESFQPYVEATGRAVEREALNLYGMAWHLKDIALFIGWLRSSHADHADTRAALANLDVAAARLEAYIPR